MAMLSNKKGSSVGAVAASKLGDFMETSKDDIPAPTSVAVRLSEDSSEAITELHLHIPLEEVLVKPPLEEVLVKPPTVHHLPQVIRPRLAQPPGRPYRPPPPLLRLGRPTPPPPPPPTSTATSSSSSSTKLRDSVFCSDSNSGSDSSDGGEGREEEREEEIDEEREEEIDEEREDVSSGSLTSQGVRCKEYREKSKLKRKAGEQDLSLETERNEKLTQIYKRQKYAIAKLKDYYLKKLSAREFKCARQEGDRESTSSISTTSHQPLVTIKTEIDLEHDLQIKLETKEEIEKN